MINNFGDLLKSQMFEKGNKKNVASRVKNLLEAFPHSIDILREVENYYIGNVKDKTQDYPKKTQEDIEALLKKEWLYLWNRNGVELTDQEIFKRYFTNITAANQQNILKISPSIKLESLGLEAKEIKERSPLTEALSHYRKGDKTLLISYLESKDILDQKETERIRQSLQYQGVHGNLPIYSHLFNKAIGMNIYLPRSFDLIKNILAEPPEEVKVFSENFIKYVVAKQYREGLVIKKEKELQAIYSYIGNTAYIDEFIQSEKKDYELQEILVFDLSSKDSFWHRTCKVLFELNKEPAHIIMNAVRNIEYLLYYQREEFTKFIQTYYAAENAEPSLGTVFNVLTELNNNKRKRNKSLYTGQTYLEVDEILERCDNVIKAYNFNKLNSLVEDKNDNIRKYKI